MIPTRRPSPLRSAVVVGLLLAASGLLPACQGGASGSGASAEKPTGPLKPGEDPRVQPHLGTFARVEAMVTRWDALRNDGRMLESRALEPKIRAEVDADFPTFVSGARGSLGPHAQYLAVSALGFSGRPEATAMLVEVLGTRDPEVAGNALIALGIRQDPNTPMDVLLNRVTPAAAAPIKRYAPLALAKVMEARAAAGIPPNAGVRQQAVMRLGALAVDPDPVVRLHVVRGLQATQSPAAYDYLAVLVGDPQMRVRWAAAGTLARIGDPRGFPGVVRLLHDAAPESKHVIRDILVSYAGNMQGRPLTEAEVDSLGTGPRAWSQWYTEFRRARGMSSGQNVQPHGAMMPGPQPGRRTQPMRPVQPIRPVQPTPRAIQPAPQPQPLPPPTRGARGGG